MTGGLAHHMESPRHSGQILRQGTNVPLWAKDVVPTGKPIPQSLMGGKDRAVSHLKLPISKS